MLGVFCALAGCPDGDALSGSCLPNESKECPCGDGVVGFQVCDVDGLGWSACDCGQGPDATGAPDAAISDGSGPCVQTDRWAGKVCVEDTVFWVDNCGVKTELVKECDAPVEACQDGDCEVVCASKAYRACHGDDVWWFDACENKEELFKTCDGNTACSGDDCVEVCRPNASTECYNGNVWAYDSCGDRSFVQTQCDDTQFCANGACVKMVLSGNWNVVANPSSKVVGGFATLTYGDSLLTLDDTAGGGVVSGTIPFLGSTIDYTGTVTGKIMTLSGQYTDNTGTTHDELWDVTFTDINTFEGIISDDVNLQILGPTQVVWNITGTRQ